MGRRLSHGVQIFTVSYEAMQRAFGADAADYLALLGHQRGAKSIAFAPVDVLEEHLLAAAKADPQIVRAECRGWLEALRRRRDLPDETLTHCSPGKVC